ncbi:BAG family molecular chaperone regulator 1 isoform 3-T3 [Vipera latastei]
MAGPYERSAMIVTVTYGNEKHNLQVDSQEGSQPTVHDLALLTEQVTGVPVSFQKLIYKGKSLKEMEQPLSTLGVKNGCKVMLIGKRNSPEEETELKKLKVLEKSVEHLAKKIDEVNKELREIQKILPDNFNDSKQKKKGLVKKIQAFLAQCDTVEGNIGQEMDKLHSKNMVLAE